VLAAVVDGVRSERSGRAELMFEGRRWRVAYPSLAALGLPLFP
jgi:hypothetical protein